MLPWERRETTPRFTIPYLGLNSTWLQSGAGVIAGIALAAMLLLTSLLTELLPSDGKPAQPLPEAEAPADAPDSQRNAANTPGSEDE